MHHRDETQLDFFLPAGDQFVLIVGAICPQVLIGAGRAREEVTRPAWLRVREEESTRNREC